MTFLRRHAVPLFLGVLTLLMVGPMLWPGYILTLDMPWTPQVPLLWSAHGFNNAFPIYALLALLSWIMPSWIVQKLLLTGIVFLLFYVPWRWLPMVASNGARVAAAMLYALNPFVYARMLAGQWGVLVAYALLPFFLSALLRLMEEPDRKGALRFTLALVLLSLGAIHFTYLALSVSLLFVSVYAGVRVGRKEYRGALRLARQTGLGIVLFLFISTYWLVPALMRSAPQEHTFTTADATTFAAAQNERTPVTLNVLALGGFWGEQQAWRYYFLWPQDTRLFWVATLFIGLLVLYGVYAGVCDPHMRSGTLMLVCIGILAYITALGAAQTPLYDFNLWLYQHVPGWNGLRDSHKIAAFLALVYATLFGMGISRLLAHMQRQTTYRIACAVFILLPAYTGMYQWWGWHEQLNPVWYPQAWYDVQAALMRTQDKTLVLPWHQYLSLPFAHQLLVANPTPTFFGRDRIIASKDSEIGGLAPSTYDATSTDIDTLMQSAATYPTETLRKRLIDYGISHILIMAPPEAGTPDAETIAACMALATRIERYGDLTLITL